MPHEVGDLVDTRGEDDRRREQEREPRRVLVVEPAHETADHRDAGPADPGEQGADLGEADEYRLGVVQRLDTPAAGEPVTSVARARCDPPT